MGSQLNSIVNFTPDAIEIALDNYKVRGLTNSNQNAPVLLCLHGWLDNAASFLPLMPWLNDYHVIAIDWPGHGLSDHRGQDAHYYFMDYVYDLLQVFHVQRWQNVHIVGHSMGGMIATAFAAAFPENVSKLTLIDALGFIACDENEVTKQLRKGLLSRLKIRDKSLSLHSDTDAATKARVQVSDLSFAHAKLIVERGMRNQSGGVVWRSDMRLRATSPYRLSPGQADKLFRDLKTPAQLIYGSEGMEFVQNALNKYQASSSLVESHSLAGGHHVHMEQPEKCSELIRSFFHKK